MAVLDASLKDRNIISESEYYNILARMELREAKEFRYHDNKGIEKKMTMTQALKRVNRMLAKEKQQPLSLSWVKKHWNK